MLFNNSLLILDAVAFYFVPILFTETHIESDVPWDFVIFVFLPLAVLHKGHWYPFLPKPSIFTKQLLQTIANTEGTVKN